VAYLVLLGPGGRPAITPGQAAAHLIAFLVSIVGVAGIGHVLNDLEDEEQDRRAGRPGAVASLSRTRRRWLLAGLLVAAVIPWVFLEPTPTTWALLALELALFVTYSVPPVRLKERGPAALANDAAYAYLVPVALTVAAFAALSAAEWPSTSVTVALLVWAFATGIRGIAFHQVRDVDVDRRAGVSTWATTAGPARVRAVAAGAVAVEVIALADWVVAARATLQWGVVAFVAAFGWRWFQRRVLGAGAGHAVPEPADRIHRVAHEYLNHVYERWVPVVLLVLLAVRSGGYVGVLAAHVLLFPSGLGDLLRTDLPATIGLRTTAAYHLTHRVARRRLLRADRRSADRPPAERVPGRGRFVYVVCGGADHVRTLHRSLQHLLPRTAQEVVVVTDSRRNEEPIDHPVIVDVRTPDELDAHHSSIWLKTSLHRHVPLDRPACYLDSDVLAVRDDVDDVFDHLVAPVTFAADQMIRDNSVDRFSPWAMTCACTGFDDTAECGHLREGMADLWGVEVPGSWLHWNGGVFLFDGGSGEFLDAWHQRALEAFADPRFKTRDQHALIATVWAQGLAAHARLDPAFNLIVDLGNYHVSAFGGHRYSVHPELPPVDGRLLHLYSNDLADPAFDLHRDVDEVVLRQMARRSADSVRQLRVLFGPDTVFGLLLRGIDAVLRHAVWPAVNVLRRAGRSIRRRGNVLVGRTPSTGGRLDAVRFPRGWRDRPRSSAEVEAYYEDWHERYVEGFGEVLQTFRSKDPSEFLLRLGELAGLQPGQRVLDAGCGVGGPAVLYAEHFGVEVDGVTLSQKQVDHARGVAEREGVADRVRFHKGDFHDLTEVFEPGTFDVVVFLEAFCHTDHPGVVLESVHRVLKPGGHVFIKDLFRARGATPEEEADIAVAVRNTEHHCHLKVRPADEVRTALQKAGFVLEVDEPFELYPDFDYDTGNDFVLRNGIDIFEGRPSTYLSHVALRARAT